MLRIHKGVWAGVYPKLLPRVAPKLTSKHEIIGQGSHSPFFTPAPKPWVRSLDVLIPVCNVREKASPGPSSAAPASLPAPPKRCKPCERSHYWIYMCAISSESSHAELQLSWVYLTLAGALIWLAPVGHPFQGLRPPELATRCCVFDLAASLESYSMITNQGECYQQRSPAT